ncbi:GtrA family protein [Corynebacterium choanae]|uniref:GtrA-like protein n=1 Tax=Corynebacterium choanae TaxID=1862358 RepID=A0A3G6J9U6_9CORY|nr:GtrA family protein [Corynebacterium choanae]AZA13220.1 GtrA-like protein [Corynebacterium choanae]
MAVSRTDLAQFLRFGIVGGSGTVVNAAVVVLLNKLTYAVLHVTEHDTFVNLLGTRFNIRWYHVFFTIAFLVANTWNYQLNRMWTFRSGQRRGWWREFFPFLTTGIGALIVSLIVMTLLMNPHSPLSLPSDVFDDSTGLRTKLYWATLISIVVSMPINFVVNKLWTFRGIKS